jgi:hypothetical protein
MIARGLLLATASGVLLSGCGASETERAGTTVKTYLAALADRDGQRACDQLTGEAQRTLVSGLIEELPELAALSCPDAVRKMGALLGPEERATLKHAEVRVTLDGDKAMATPVGGTDTVDLVKTESGWLISGGFRF